jgi:signal transduction histidine kinase
LGALRQGAYDFLRKPVPPDILLHSVARSVQKLSLTLETERQEKEIRKLLDRSQEDLKDARTLSSFKGFMISMAAHDFRSIITVLDGYLQLIKDRCKGCDVSGPGGMLEQAARTINRLRTMSGTLLDYEAAESGTIHLDIRPFPLADMLKECIAFYRPYAEQKKVHLVLEGDPRGVTVSGDRGKVMQILDNLLYNALKFTPSQGTIRLSGKKEDGFAVISVSDSGAGIPKEKLKKIFDQGDIVATLDSHARLGLGLTICKRLVEAQKGKIRIDSVPGKGTQVHFSLPSA